MDSQGTVCATQDPPTNGQKRAKKGGETGPNGEWYPPGAFIATKDLPKRTRDWLSRLPLERPVVIELPSRTSAAKVAQREIGLVSIATAISEVFTYGEVINEVYIGYLRSRGGGEFADQLLSWVDLYKSGARLVSIYEHPDLATVEDLVLLAKAGRSMPPGALEKKAPKVREHIEHVMWTSTKRSQEG
ncbi:hypothetical protein [Acidovorax delafieldii]|uniref:hypothetical protein n=1 Tax=Acidovorax delafieldii TaxID=47920 RepID=UPI003ECCF45F